MKRGLSGTLGTESGQSCSKRFGLDCAHHLPRGVAFGVCSLTFSIGFGTLEVYDELLWVRCSYILVGQSVLPS